MRRLGVLRRHAAQAYRLVIITGLLAPIACSGSASSVPSNALPANFPVAAATAGSTTQGVDPKSVQVSLHLQLPTSIQATAPAKLGATRKRQFISPSNTLITIAVTPLGGSVTNFGPSACTTVSCAINFTATPGPNTIGFTLTDGSSNVLSRFSTTTIVQPSTLNTLNFSANGAVSSVTLSLASASVPAGTASSTLLTVNAKDAANNTIVGNNQYVDINGNPVTLALSVNNNQAGGDGTVSLNGPTRITGPGQAATSARYDGQWLASSDISVSAIGGTVGSTNGVTLTTVGTVAHEYPIPSGTSNANGIVLAGDGNIWFAEYNTNKIAKCLPNGTITEYPGANQINNLVMGPDGNLWGSEYAPGAQGIARILLTGSVTTYTTPSGGSQPWGITSGHDGNLWFTEWLSNKIGRSTPNGVMQEYLIPSAVSDPLGIIAGLDGNIWFAESNVNKIGKITPAGVISEYPTTGAPQLITPGPDGNVWFTEIGNNKIGRVTPSGTVTEFTVPTSISNPNGITVGPDNNIWITEYSTNKIARVTTSGVFTEYTLPNAGSQPWGIVTGPDGNLWITEAGGNRIGVFVL